MDSNQKKIRKKKDKKPIFILAGFLVFFAVFIYLITLPSEHSIAIKELQTSYNKKDVEMVWYKYKANLYQDEEFLFEVKNKLTKLNMSDDDIKDCLKWLPPAPTSINLIVVPDLSGRINDEKNNPRQIKNDIFILNSIWKSFKDYSKLKKDSKDNLIIDVTDIKQANGNFSNVANYLQFDLATHKGKSNRLYFTANKDKQFINNINKLYKLAKVKTLGANYRSYMSQYLSNRIKKTNFFTTYKNKVIFITDGYIEYENQLTKKITSDTKIAGYEKLLYPTIASGTTVDIIRANNLGIPTVKNLNLTETEFLVCELNERDGGISYHLPILKAYWEDWLQRMGVKHPIIQQREQANIIAQKKIETFISN